MNNLETKLITDFEKFGCTKKNAAATFQVYIELTEVKRMDNVNYFFSKNLKRMYLTAKHTRSSDISVYLPVSTCESISLFEIMRNMNKECPDSDIHIALLTSDSTCVYYRVARGLEDPSKESAMKTVFEKRKKLDIDINLKRNQIQEAAKSCNLSNSKSEQHN